MVTYEVKVSTESRYHDVDDLELASSNNWAPERRGSQRSGYSTNKHPNDVEDRDMDEVSIGGGNITHRGEADYEIQHTNRYIEEFRTESAVDARKWKKEKKGGLFGNNPV